MAAAALALLAVGVVGAFGRIRREVLTALPVVAALVAVGCGVVDADAAGDVLGDMVEPLAFLLVAVPLAALLDDLAVFDAVARRLPARRLAAGMWVLGAATVALVNLDAAVVLLVPVAIRVAVRVGEDPRGMAVQPALLACLASSFLPVSNLTNLVAEERDPRGPGAYLVHLGLPSLAAVAVGYVLWRRWWPAPTGAPAPAAAGPGDRAALVTGAVAGGVLLVGFTVGAALGVAPWAVAGVVLAGLAVRARRVPLSAVPWSAAVAVAGLAVLAVAVAGRLDLAAVLGDGDGAAGTGRVVAVGAVAANLTNNLPAFVAGWPALPGTDAARWAWLLGVNAGPTLAVTGSLSGLLWLEVARRSGIDVGWRDYLAAGLRVGLPALAAATAVLVLVT